ncbi:Clathrin interactor EPSIN 1 isoform B [Glycine soja]|uniref:Clathrin interactor EPSIN 1 isoform B n=1 Tax=Glycine soja TaxID=3848 RepID=A0A445GAS5_GLYSO|nr:Clathrin interactor EPSIN 1 isoform B [Glycine soja]
MDFMKVFDQTVREIKREVNLKVLKVPEIEQKVLDATDNEPWGPHGTVLAEISQATKKFTECQMIMNVLWTRLGETGKDWRYVYKALAVIEYLVAHGSERAVDDIIEHTFQISALSSFEYVEPSGKDVGLNVRKKAENIVSLLNDKDKIHEVRNKAAANRDKYIGVSSSGITYKSGSASSYGSGSSFQSSGKYGGFGSRDGDRFNDSYRDKGSYEEEKDYQGKSHHATAGDNQENSFKKGSARSARVYRSSLYMPKPPKSIFHHLLYNRRYSNPLSNSFVSNFILSSLTTHPPQHPHLRYTYFILMLALDRPTLCSVQNRRSYRNAYLDFQFQPLLELALGSILIVQSPYCNDYTAPILIPECLSCSKSQENKSSRVSKSSTNANNYGSVPSQSSSVPANSTEDDMDDFDPRGTSTKTSAGNSNQVDLFGQDLIGDLMDAPTSVPVEKAATSNVPEVDLFADASFVSAEPHVDKGAISQPQAEVDLFSSQPAIPAVTPTVDLFSIPELAVQPNNKSEKSVPMNNSTIDPFAAVPLNNFDGSDIFGDFTSQSDSVSSQPSNNVVSDGKHDNVTGKSLADSKVSPKKDAFQVKSGVWADSLSRGLIDLNITAPKKVSLVDVGIVGGLSDGSDEREKGPPPSFYMGRAMGSGSGLGMGRSGFTPSQPIAGDDFFSNLGNQQYQFGGFQK